MTAEQKKPPFTLPVEPADGYLVAYYRVGGSLEDPWIKHVRCVYHVNAKWADVYPELAAERGPRNYGPDFVDQWHIVSHGLGEGRTAPGWTSILDMAWDASFVTFEEAKGFALEQLTKAHAAAKAQVGEMERRIAAMHHLPKSGVRTK